MLPYLSRSGQSVLDLSPAPYGLGGLKYIDPVSPINLLDLSRALYGLSRVKYIDEVSPNLPDADMELWHDALEGLVDTRGCQHRYTVYSSKKVAQSATGCWYMHRCSDQGCVFAMNTADVQGGARLTQAGIPPYDE